MARLATQPAYVGIDLDNAPRVQADKAEYFIVFNHAPIAALSFFLKKNPRFITREDAFKALDTYRFEFGVDGYVCSKFGPEPEPVQAIPVYDVEYLDMDVPQ
jgi:hypothetical protein